MKTLFLMRHAKSSWKDPTLADHDRPLNKRGQRDAPRMGKRLAARQVQPGILVTSPAVRARKTAARIACEIGYQENRIVVAEGMYQGGTTGMLDVIRGLENAAATAMLFGHNPATTDLVNYLAHTDIENIPTCGVAEIRFYAESWADVVRGGGELVDFDYPKRVDD
jgi:phosphohistidine phosphatase